MFSPAPETRTQNRPFPLRLYAALLDAAGPILEAYLRRRLKAGKEDASRFSERHGVPSRPRPDGFLVWFHAASVGESMSMLRLVDRLLADSVAGIIG